MSKTMRRQTPTPTLSTASARGRLVLVTALLVTACGQTSFSADEHLAQAQQAYAEGNLRTAIIEVKNALQQDPTQADARRLLGEYNLELGNGVEAEAELERAREFGADPAQLRLPLLRAWQMQGKHDEVIAATEEEVPSDAAQRPQVLTLRAQALLAQGQPEAARNLLNQVLDLQPTDAEALLSMAWLEWLQPNPAEARTYLQAALESDPQSDRAWELLGDLERDAGQLDEAEAAYTKAMETTGLPFSPQLKRALARVVKQDYDGAEQDVNALKKQANQHPAVSYINGLIAFNQQDYERARTDLEESLARDPSYTPAMFYLGAAQYALGNWQQSVSYLNRYVRRDPNSPEANRLLALARIQDGDSERAERVLDAVLERDPQDQATLAMMSNLYLSQGRTDEALHHLRQVIALEPESAATRAQLGLALVQDGQREAGFSELERALELAPEEDNVRLEIAMIAERLRAKEYTQALTLIEGLRGRDGIQPALYYNLKGLAYIGQGDRDTAEAVFREGLETVPDAKADLATNLAGILAQDGRLEEAQALASDALENDPDHLGLLTNLARLSAAEGDLEQTETLLQRAVAAHPQTLAPLRGLAELYLQTDRQAEAVSVLRAGQEAHGDSVEWLRLMSLAELRSGDRQAAVASLRKLQERQPEVALLLGRVLVELGQRDEALIALEQGLEQRPDHLEARLIVVELLTQNGQLDKATEMLAPALETHPDHPQVLGRVGAIAYNQDRLADALDAFQRAVERSPNDRYLIGALAEVQADSGDLAASISTLSAWVDTHPQDQSFILLLANQLLAQERNEEAVKTYQQLLEIAPDNAIALNNLAWLMRQQDADEALRLVNRAIEIVPNAGSVWDTKGIIEMEQGQYSAAIDSLRKALELSPEEPSIHLHLAKALLADGRDDQARSQLDRLIADFPESDAATEAKDLLR